MAARSHDRSSPLLEVGNTIDRYTILDVLGTGGTGVVYAAHDPDLDRKIALKLLRPSIRQPQRFERRRARLVREAQALARLSHPNVVPVYDVGIFADRVFVAMEFVEGPTLRRWLREAPRSLPEILDKFIQAGRGLAAAHAADIVHRDFKPDNVLVGLDGRVRVLDFGLATPGVDASSSSGRHAVTEDRLLVRTTSATGSHRLETARYSLITTHGQIMGTPAYMAPEQGRGEPADARADQYSFCMTLWEALYGERRPNHHVLSGDPSNRPAPPSARAWARRHDRGRRSFEVPVRIQRLLDRGLSLDPAQRFPDMNSLLAQLEQPRRGARRWLLAGAGAVALASAALAGQLEREVDKPICTGAEDQLVEVWDEARRERLRERLTGSGRPYAQQTWQTLSRELDRWAERWVSTRTEACVATHERGEQSPKLLDLRMACLDRQATTVAVLTESLTAPLDEGELIDDRLDRSLQAALDLPDPRRCQSAHLLHEGVLDGGEVDSEVEELRLALARGRGSLQANELAQARAIAEHVAEQAEALEQDAVLADARLLLGTVQSRAGEHEAAELSLREAAFLAQASGQDELIIEASAALVQHLVAQARLAQAADWVGLGRATLARLGGDPQLEADLLQASAALARERGDFAAALLDQERVVTLREHLQGSEHPELAEALSERAFIEERLGRYDESQASADRALEILGRELGEQHPAYAHALNRYGSVLRMQGRHEHALAAHRRALEIFEQAYGSRHPSVAATHTLLASAYDVAAEHELAYAELDQARLILEGLYGRQHAKLAVALLNLGTVAHSLGRDDEALELLREASERIRVEHGEDHISYAFALNNLGEVLLDRGELDEALRCFQGAQRIWVARVGEDNQVVGLTMGNVARALHEQERYAEALELQTEALQKREAALGSEHALLAEHLLWIGEHLLALARNPDAREPLERGIRLAEGAERPDVELLGQLRFALARALWPDDPLRARELARLALEQLGESKSSAGRARAANARAWVDGHRR